MKKWISLILCLVLLVYCLPIAVIAKQEQTPETTTSTSSSSTTSSTSSTTPTTTPPRLNFSFQYSNDCKRLFVTWNAKDAPNVFVTGVEFDNNGKRIEYNNNSGRINVDITHLYAGFHTMTCILNNGQSINADKLVERAGKLDISMSLKLKGNRINATLKDNYGRPVAGYPVRLFISNNEMPSVKTDKNGCASFLVPSKHAVIRCVANDSTKQLSVGSILYSGDEESMEIGQSSGTTLNPTTKTRSNTKPSTENNNIITTRPNITKSTTSNTTVYPIINGAGTTSVVDNTIAVNVSFDSEIIKKFKYSQKDFASRARLFVPKELYASVIGDSNASLMLLAKTSTLKITDEHITNAVSDSPKYSYCHANNTERIPLDLSMIFVDKANDISLPVSMPASEVTVELPIPKSMNAKKQTIVAALCNETGITQILDTTVDDGTLKFKTDRMSSVVILGFETAGKHGNIPVALIIMIIAGIVMLGSIVALIIFIVKKPVFEDIENDLDPENDTQGSAINGSDVSHENEYPNSKPQKSVRSRDTEPPNSSVPGVSLGSLAESKQNDKPKKKNPSDYDIDL